MENSLFNTTITCRICNSNNLTDVIHIGEQDITSRFPVYGDFSTPKTPIDLCICQKCGLLQLRQTTRSNELYEYEYGYRSGISNTMKDHLKQYQGEMASKVQLLPNDVVVDIGSNDSTMLQYYPSNLKRIGIDPTGKQFKQYYGEVELIENYFTKDNFCSVYGETKCKIISSISMFYDLPDPVQFAKDIYYCLDDDGVWTCEQSYLVTMLKRNSFDTICHEHLEYYALKQIKEIADRSNFKIIDVLFNDCNGGSFRIYFAKKSSLKHVECCDLIQQILADENNYGINDSTVYKKFMTNCDIQMKRLCNFIDTVNKNGKEVWLYGASTKGNCLLQYANIKQNRVRYAVERNLNKVGKMTSTGIEIISEETMRKNPPAYLLVLPWHFRDEIIEREKEYLEQGGQIIFPLPKFEIVSYYPRTLITGCDGLIASYLIESMNKTNTLYGIGHITETYDQSITKFYFDINDSSELEEIVLSLNPNIIIHLAGISSSFQSFHDPIQTLKTNGLVTASLCDIIFRNSLSSKLFNASSSEIFKGHIKYTVEEDDKNMFHLHPYSIAKTLGHNIVEFYRKTYNLPFSNGIIFTTESPRKKQTFLFNKVADHAKKWRLTNKPLELGNLDSMRCVLHAKDVANAIQIIIEQNNGDSYLICNNESMKVIDIVIEIYNHCGITLCRCDNQLVETTTRLPVIILGDGIAEIDNTIIDIRGNSTKLNNLGWKQTININDLIADILFGK